MWRKTIIAPRRRAAAEAGPWSRQRLLVMLFGFGVAVVILLTGLGLFVWYAVTDRHPSTAQAGQVAAPQADWSARDRIALAPMVSVDAEAAFTPDPATTAVGEIRVPVATDDRGPAGVPTGFPRTAEGAVGQLAAIERLVLESMSLPVTRQVHQAWVQPGGPTLEEWELTRNVQAFLAHARQGGTEKDLTTLVTVTPAAGLVKGSDGPGWTVVCVLMDVQAAIRTESRMGYGLCSRMEWIEGRWQVAAGVVPARAPSVWPGSRAAAQAGWLTWTDDRQGR